MIPIAEQPRHTRTSMPRDQSTDFSLGALYAAIDAQRESRGLNWEQAVREINRASQRVPVRPISRSTVTGLRTKAVAEGDGVLQMLVWLNRTPESFVPGHEEPPGEDATLPRVEPYQILRFDAKAIYSALEAERVKRRMSWIQVARETGGINAASVASLTRLAKGGRVGFPYVMRICRWLDRPAASFTRIADNIPTAPGARTSSPGSGA
jgi:hypothetical protein